MKLRSAMKLLIVSVILISATFGDDLPAEVQKLVDIREKELNRLNLSYLQRLDALLVDYRAKGDTDVVAAIEALIEQVEKPAPAKDSPPAEASGDEVLKALVGVWKRDYDGGVWKFENTKGGVFNGKMRFAMTYDAKTKRVLVVGDSWSDQLTFGIDPDVVNGVTDNNGRKNRFKLRRVK